MAWNALPDDLRDPSLGTLKMREWKMRHGQNCGGWKMQEWKYRHDSAGVENAGVEISGGRLFDRM